MTEFAENIVPFLRREERALSILVVEDDRIERMFMEQQIKELGHVMIAAENGKQAIDLINDMKGRIDIIMMDRMMPVMDGLTAVRRIKDDPLSRRIPIVMVTGAASARDIQEGIDAGVFYYLTKPVNEEVLKSVLCAATREVKKNYSLSEELKKHKTSFNLIHTCKFNLRTLEEAESLSAFIAHCFPDPERVLPGLTEILLNAIEHGTYDIGYDRKTDLVAAGTWKAEILRRQSLPDYQDKFVEVIVTRKDEGIYAVITDQGNGFEWKKYMAIEPSRANDNHGRGIAQAKALSFDRLTYNESGNQAIGFVNFQARIEW